MPPDVFLSHASEDAETARAVVAVLESDGLGCWIAPRDVPPGAEWAAAISEAVGASRLLMLLLSQASQRSPEVVRELALAGDRPILAVRIDPTEPRSGLRYFLATAQWLDAFAPAVEAHHERIVQTARRLIDAEDEAPPPEERQTFRPPTHALLEDLSTDLGRFQDLTIKLLAVLGESSRVLARNETANQSLIEKAIAFNEFAPGFVSRLPAYGTTIRSYWGMDRAREFAEVQRVVEDEVYRGGVGAMNDIRSSLNALYGREDVDEEEWRRVDADKDPRILTCRDQVKTLTRLWTGLRAALDQAL